MIHIFTDCTTIILFGYLMSPKHPLICLKFLDYLNCRCMIIITFGGFDFSKCVKMCNWLQAVNKAEKSVYREVSESGVTSQTNQFSQ